MDKLPLVLTSLLIGIAAIANLVRFIWNIPVAVGSLFLPGWTGGVLFIILGLLSAWSLRAIFSSPSSNH